MSQSRRTKLIREKDYVAEVAVDLVDSSEPWGPYLSLADARKLDEVRSALRRGDIAAALKWGDVYHLTPMSAR